MSRIQNDNPASELSGSFKIYLLEMETMFATDISPYKRYVVIINIKIPGGTV